MSKKDVYTREEDKRFTLRIEKDLFKKVEESAHKNKRAIGREIAFILEQYFEEIDTNTNSKSTEKDDAIEKELEAYRLELEAELKGKTSSVSEDIKRKNA